MKAVAVLLVLAAAASARPQFSFYNDLFGSSSGWKPQPQKQMQTYQSSPLMSQLFGGRVGSTHSGRPSSQRPFSPFVSYGGSSGYGSLGGYGGLGSYGGFGGLSSLFSGASQQAEDDDSAAAAIEDTDAEETADEAAAAEAEVEGTDNEEATIDEETSSDNAAGEETASDNTTAEETSSDNTAAEETSSDDTTTEESSSDSTLDSFAQEMLDAHNVYRNQHQASNLTYDSEIAAFALEWAENLSSLGVMKHRTENNPYGENIYWTSASSATAQAAVDAWYSEVKDYTDYTTDPFADGQPSFVSGHFTQVVWKSSEKLGCGKSSSSAGTYVVCNYSPQGNYIGQFTTNVLPIA